MLNILMILITSTLVTNSVLAAGLSEARDETKDIVNVIFNPVVNDCLRPWGNYIHSIETVYNHEGYRYIIDVSFVNYDAILQEYTSTTVNTFVVSDERGAYKCEMVTMALESD